MHSKKIITLLSLLALTACSDKVKRSFGISRSAPDEFKVISNPPLSIPPEFTLRPPQPGQPPLAKTPTSKEAEQLMFGGAEGASSSSAVKRSNLPSRGEENFLNHAEANSADPEIRDELSAEERAELVEQKKKGYLSKTVDFLRGNNKAGDDKIVNPVKEKERITENKTEGKPLNEGDVPVVEDKDRGVIGRVMDKLK